MPQLSGDGVPVGGANSGCSHINTTISGAGEQSRSNEGDGQRRRLSEASFERSFTDKNI